MQHSAAEDAVATRDRAHVTHTVVADTDVEPEYEVRRIHTDTVARGSGVLRRPHEVVGGAPAERTPRCAFRQLPG